MLSNQLWKSLNPSRLKIKSGCFKCLQYRVKYILVLHFSIFTKELEINKCYECTKQYELLVFIGVIAIPVYPVTHLLFFRPQNPLIGLDNYSMTLCRRACVKQASSSTCNIAIQVSPNPYTTIQNWISLERVGCTHGLSSNAFVAMSSKGKLYCKSLMQQLPCYCVQSHWQCFGISFVRGKVEYFAIHTLMSESATFHCHLKHSPCYCLHAFTIMVLKAFESWFDYPMYRWCGHIVYQFYNKADSLPHFLGV